MEELLNQILHEVKEIKQGQVRLETRMDKLEQNQEQLVLRMDKLESRMDKLESRDH
ncbi:hypothetical protein B4064_0959 [Caldibacillus thermoamylovorans]|uniref:hypothetical protein n=1 Tax=Caldibacillus thermoamylovorans TaxID=35841 RepID=UPI0005B70428|nr:hypothetical protein [Caldibacillus thermoamylovorans]KIO68320.1 hypothetical protein B4064_0959 [Caldibacillus thermoamylovorans]